jgi:hypothetical protein
MMAAGFGKAELTGPGVHAGPEPFVVNPRVAVGRDPASRPGALYGGGPALSEPAAGEPRHGPAAVTEPGSMHGIRTAAGLSASTLGVSPLESPSG